MPARITATLQFLAANPRLLAFGLLMPFASAFGQTFFIGLFGEPLRTAFELSNARFGGLYSLATLTSAGLLMWLGRFMDRVDLRRYTLVVGLAYGGACLFMAAIPAWAPLLFVAFLLLRLTGQGLMSHIGMTAMGRYFEAGRGRAVSVASLGFPVAEAMFPPVGVAVIAFLGWRTTWGVLAALVAFGIVPLALWLLRGHGERERLHQAGMAARAASGRADGDWRVSQVLRDPRFYLMLPASLLSPFAVTGVFFHQAAIVAAKGWTMDLFAAAFVPFAAASVVGTLITGALIDRLGARRVLPVAIWPIAAGLALLALGNASWIALGFMVLTGLTAGATLTLQGALWAEVYGTAHLGSVRSMVYGLMVVSTAASPVLFGAALDSGVSVEGIATGCVAVAVVASGLAVPVAVGARDAVERPD